MLDLDSEKWVSLSVPTGDARRIPTLLTALQNDPSTKNFDHFWDELTGGGGELVICNAFFAAMPHAIAALRLLHGAARAAAIALIGWGVALAGYQGKKIPRRFSDAYHAALPDLVELSSALVEQGVSPRYRPWLFAAMAAGAGRFPEALSIIDEIWASRRNFRV